MFEESAIKHILSAKVWLYGFEIDFWQNLTDFLFCLIVVLFVTAKKLNTDSSQFPSLETQVIVKL